MSQTAPPDLALERLIGRLRALPEPGMRLVALAEAITARDDDAAVTLLEGLVRHAERRGARDPGVARVLVEVDLLAEAVGYDRIRSLFEHAQARGSDSVARLFVAHAARGYAAPAGQSPELTLGHRKNLARRVSRERLGAFLFDPDPAVVENVLLNPLLTEADVVRIASRRPADPRTLRLVAEHPRWSTRPRIRAALAYNPYTPVNLALALVLLLPRADARALARDATVHPWVRERARARCEPDEPD